VGLRNLVIAGLVVLAGVLAWSLRPVCVPLSRDAVRAANPPLESRTDRDWYVRVFQRRNGEWHQCRTWLSRQFYF
jgi:hypothetical protein